MVNQIVIPNWDTLPVEDKAKILLLITYRFKLRALIKKYSGLRDSDFEIVSLWRKPGDCTLDIRFTYDQPGVRVWVTKIEVELGTHNIFPVVDSDLCVADFTGTIRKKLQDKGNTPEVIVSKLGPEIREAGIEIVSSGESHTASIPVPKKGIPLGIGESPIEKHMEEPRREEKVSNETVRDDSTGKVTFLGTLRDILKTIIPLSELEKQYILKKYEGRLDSAELRVDDPSLLSRVLFLLEKRGYVVMVIGQSVIISTDKAVIEKVGGYKSIRAELSACRDWFELLEEWLSENNVNARIISHPLILVLHNYEKELEIEGASRVEADVLAELFRINHVGIRQNIRMIYVTVSALLVKKDIVSFDVSSFKEGLSLDSNDGGVEIVCDY